MCYYERMKIKQYIVPIVLLIIIVYCVGEFWLDHRQGLHDRAWRGAQKLAMGVRYYYLEFEVLPPLENEELIEVLTISNFQLEMSSMGPGEKWNGIDVYGHPFKVFLSGDDVVVRSFGPNGRDDGGTYDDIQQKRAYKFD